VGGNIERVSSLDVLYKARGPGPGQYEVAQPIQSPQKAKADLKSTMNSDCSFLQSKDLLAKRMKNSEYSFQSTKPRVLPPGPGAYNIPGFGIEKEVDLAR
jgi:hypothetical protein